jgi:hypothetical protein
MQAVKIVARDAKTHRGCLVEKGQDFEVELCWEIQEAEWNEFILFCVVSIEHSEESLERGGDMPSAEAPGAAEFLLCFEQSTAKNRDQGRLSDVFRDLILIAVDIRCRWGRDFDVFGIWGRKMRMRYS